MSYSKVQLLPLHIPSPLEAPLSVVSLGRADIPNVPVTTASVLFLPYSRPVWHAGWSQRVWRRPACIVCGRGHILRNKEQVMQALLQSPVPGGCPSNCASFPQSPGPTPPTSPSVWASIACMGCWDSAFGGLHGGCIQEFHLFLSHVCSPSYCSWPPGASLSFSSTLVLDLLRLCHWFATIVLTVVHKFAAHHPFSQSPVSRTDSRHYGQMDYPKTLFPTSGPSSLHVFGGTSVCLSVPLSESPHSYISSPTIQTAVRPQPILLPLELSLPATFVPRPRERGEHPIGPGLHLHQT